MPKDLNSNVKEAKEIIAFGGTALELSFQVRKGEEKETEYSR